MIISDEAMHHLTQFKYEDTSFEGWRVAVQRSGILFCRYFSTLEYGGEEEARQEAIRLRDALLEALERTPNQPQEVFRLFAKEKPAELYPAGLCPPRPGQHDNNKRQEHSFTVKCKPGLHARVRQLVTHLKLDYSSVMRLALYTLYTFICQKNNRDKTLRQLVSILEQANSNHTPTLSEFINQPPAAEEPGQHNTRPPFFSSPPSHPGTPHPTLLREQKLNAPATPGAAGAQQYNVCIKTYNNTFKNQSN